MKYPILLFLLISGYGLNAQYSDVNLGNLKINHHIKDTMTVRSFYKDVLGMELHTPKSKVPRDYLTFSNGFRLNIIYQNQNAPTPEDFMKALWIRIHVKDFKALADKIRDSKAKVFKDYPEREEIYFQAPGGQVFRMEKN
ncbi:VOC family protein [Flagellimonas sp. 2504JD1-5]